MLSGLVKQFTIGTNDSKYQVIRILLYLHSTYGEEKELNLMRDNRDNLLLLLDLQDSEWRDRNLAVKGFCVFFKENIDKMYFIEHGILEIIFKDMKNKPEDLQEANLVLLLSLCSHPDVPDIVINKGGCDLISIILCRAAMTVIIDLSSILLKTLALYQWDVVEHSVIKNIPPERADLRKLDSPDCTYFGSEYGMFVQEYLQKIIKNRREQRYLLMQFRDEEGNIFINKLGISPLLLQAYQKVQHSVVRYSTL